jgi:hypothetical protein
LFDYLQSYVAERVILPGAGGQLNDANIPADRFPRKDHEHYNHAKVIGYAVGVILEGC